MYGHRDRVIMTVLKNVDQTIVKFSVICSDLLRGSTTFLYFEYKSNENRNLWLVSFRFKFIVAYDREHFKTIMVRSDVWNDQNLPKMSSNKNNIIYN